MMTKGEAAAYIRRARQDLRDAEQALRAGDRGSMLVAVLDAGGCMGELEAALDSYDGKPEGIRGVS